MGIRWGAPYRGSHLWDVSVIVFPEMHFCLHPVYTLRIQLVNIAIILCYLTQRENRKILKEIKIFVVKITTKYRNVIAA